MMQTIRNINTQVYDSTSYGLDRKNQSFKQDVSFIGLTYSDTELVKTFGRRYVKAINDATYTKFLELGSEIAESYVMTSTHTSYGSVMASYASGVGGGYTNEIIKNSTKNYTPKYLMCGNKYVTISDRNSYPTGSVFLFLNKINFILKTISSKNGKYLYLGASADGGATEHNHTAGTTSQQTVNFFGNCISTSGWYPDVPVSTNDISDRTELFIYESTDTYFSSKDNTPIGTYILQHKTEAIPSNYSEVTVVGSGLIRFANTVIEIGNTGGTETHNHSLTSDKVHSTLQCTKRKYTSSSTSTDNHMPEYIAVRVIQRDS